MRATIGLATALALLGTAAMADQPAPVELLATLPGHAMAVAETDIAGTWTLVEPGVVVDIQGCGAGWCGTLAGWAPESEQTLVARDEALCGTALFDGYQFAEELWHGEALLLPPHRYRDVAIFKTGPDSLTLSASTDGPMLMRRGVMVTMTLVRRPDPGEGCAAQPSS